MKSRFAAVSRRGFLQGMSAAAVLGLVGCGSNDADALNPATAQSPGTASASAGTASVPGATAAAGQLVVHFSYTADSSATASAGERDGRGHGGPGGMVRNPYIAVWLEDKAGKLVKTISLWHLQNGQDRWLSELHRWYSASGGVDTVSSATRAAGDFAVTWDGTDADGRAVADGGYVLCIEATREHGPYSLITADFDLAGKAVNAELPANGELSGASLTFTPA